MPTKATKTIKQVLVYKPQHAAWFEGTQALFNQVVAFYFEVIQAHPGMPLSVAIPADIPAMFRRAAIHAALGSEHSFYSHLEKWRKQKGKAVARGKKFTIRPPMPPRQWNCSVTLYAGQWKGAP